jgi:hypothetical protein
MRSTHGPFVAGPILVGSLFVAGLVLVPILSSAQIISEDVDEVSSMPAGTVSCFDHYSFGSVQAKLSTPVVSTVSGASMTFSGSLENANPYPIVDGALYVKIFKSRGSTNDGNGPDVVDQFFVKEDIVIPAKGSAPISFEWRVPAYAESGDYSVATFFTTAHKFNLLGLSFTDDVVGNRVNFKVVGEQEESVSLDKASVTVDGATYRFAAFPPRAGGDPVVVQATARNTSRKSEQATVRWTVYKWDAQREENIVHESTATITVPARGSVPVSLTVRDAEHPAYLVVAELSWKDVKSILGIRFVRAGKDSLRINFPSIGMFPLQKGVENTIFSCFHNAGENVVPNGHIELTLKNRSGWTIAEHTYSGQVTGAMMGMAQTFTPTRDYDYFVLEAKLFQGTALVDEASVEYDCAAIDPSVCKGERTINLWGIEIPVSLLYWVGGALVGVAVLAYGLWMHRGHVAPAPPTSPTL